MDRIVPILRASVERNADRVWLLGDAIPVMRPSGAADSRGDIRMAGFEAVSEADLHTFLAEIGVPVGAGSSYGRLGSGFRVHASWSSGRLHVGFRVLGEPLRPHAGTAEKSIDIRCGPSSYPAAPAALPPTATAQEAQ